MIRNKIIALAHLKRIMHFGWLKVHVGIEGNELVDRLAKEAAMEDGPVVCDKMPREVIITREKENGLHMYVNIINCKIRRQKYCYRSYNESPL